MNQLDRQNRIVEYLRIKPISHGQIYTFQIAIPESQVVEIPSERREALKVSLIEQGSNLIPLIVRRTEAYSEEEEYEVVYGADWCILAKELDIEKLWVWVFDMTDEQAAAAKVEMEQLIGSSVSNEEIASISKNVDSLLNTLKSVSSRLEKLELGQQEILNRFPPPPGKNNLNSIKTAKELEQQKIPQLGKKRAEAILILRQQKGRFQSLSELLEVKGITQKMIEQFASYLVCE